MLMTPAIGLALGAVALAATVALVPSVAAAATTGSISGTVTLAGTTHPVAGVAVEIVNGQDIVATATTTATGAYLVEGVPASAAGYLVCFDAVGIGSPQLPYEDQCYNNLFWGGPFPDPFGMVQYPEGTTPVVVRSDENTARIDAALQLFANPVHVVAQPTTVTAAYLAHRMTFSARVSDAFTGSPVVGAQVSFSVTALTHITVRCSATTNDAGVAACSSANGNVLFIRTPGRYLARSAAAPSYQEGVGYGAITHG
jgi:hypothetical protein